MSVSCLYLFQYAVAPYEEVPLRELVAALRLLAAKYGVRLEGAKHGGGLASRGGLRLKESREFV